MYPRLSRFPWSSHVPIVFALGLASCVVATAAHAECTWVLWFTSGHPARPITSPVDAFQTKDECMKQAALRMKNDVAEYKKKNPSDVASVSCLPDTVDPRGPKEN